MSSRRRAGRCRLFKRRLTSCGVNYMVDEVYGIRNGRIKAVWPVARGKVR
jgi:hypothetical protein